MQSKIPIIVFSHVSWDLYRRPRRLLSRLARSHRVFFVEEPVESRSSSAHWEFSEPEPHVVVCRPHTPCPAPGFHDNQLPHLRALIRDLVEQHALSECFVWFCTPTALPAADGLRTRAVVYECTDELSASPELSGLERELLGRADLVITASPSLYRARKDLHPNVHCLPGSVEAPDFDQAPGMREPAGQSAPAGSALLNGTSRSSTVRELEELIASTLQAKSNSPAARTAARTIVVGAGPTGLSAAYHAGPDSILIEQNSRVGGWCRSMQAGGFTFDYAGHIMFSADPYVHQLYQMLLGTNVHWQDREAWIYSKNVYTRYPFQGSLYGLPADVIKECIMGAIEARYGALKAPKGARKTNGSCKPEVKDCCADGILESSAPLVEASPTSAGAAAPRNFEEFIYKVWGAGIARHFAMPYNRKLWSVPLDEMETSWLGGRVPLPDLGEMIEGALSPSPKPMGPNARFGYPLRGGFQALMDAWLPHLEGELRLNTRVARVSPSRHTVTLNDGTELRYEHLISTMPLPVLVRQLGDEAPPNLRAAAARLRHVSVRCVHLGVGRERLTEKHWIYYPEDTVFHRIFVQGNASPHCNPPGGFGLTCEITYSPYKPLPCDGDALVQRCVEDCRKVGIIDAADPIRTAVQCDLPHAYVVYDHARAEAVREIRGWLADRQIILAGRYSEWEYYNSDHAFLAGKRAAEQAGEAQQAPGGARTADRHPTHAGAG